MKTYVTVEFKYDNKNYMFYGDTREEVKTKVDNWMKDNNVSRRPYYTYSTNKFDLENRNDRENWKVMKNKVKEYLWDDEGEFWWGFLKKNTVRVIGYFVGLLITVILMHEIQKYMFYPYFKEFVMSRPEMITSGELNEWLTTMKELVNNGMDLGYGWLTIKLFFYWSVEVINIVSVIFGWFTPNMVTYFVTKHENRKMKKYMETVNIL